MSEEQTQVLSEAEQADMLRRLDGMRLGRPYWAMFSVVGAAAVLEFFDLYIVGFIVAVIGPAWNLTYVESALVLLSAGVGSIIGALVGGVFADRFGRKSIFITAALLSGVGSLALTLLPDGQWIGFCLLRLVIGFGLGAGQAVQTPLLVEFTPVRQRAYLPGLAIWLASAGILLAALSATMLLDTLGWRGLALLGGLPVLIALAAIPWVPESLRWLLAAGHIDRARNVAKRMIAQAPADLAATPTAAATPTHPAQPLSLSATRERLVLVFVVWLAVSTAYNGVNLWAPTVLATVLSVTPKAAAGLFLWASAGGLTGKLLFAVLPQAIGRRRTAQIAGFGGAFALAAAAVWHGDALAGMPLFLLFLVASTFFIEGSYSNLAPFTAEMFPVRYSARVVGFAQAANGVGKVLGPLSLAVFAGTSDFLTPKATEAAVQPAYLFLAVCALIVGIAFSLTRVETRNESLALR